MAYKLIVGLGNPGPQYCLNRHNLGFIALDALVSYYDFPNFSIKKNCAISEGSIDQHKLILLKPLSFMNLSGPPVASVVNFYKIPLDHVYVIHDDLDLEFLRIKVKQGGGHGGHNGLKSLDQHISSNYWRIRYGIGHPGHKDLVTGHVLGNFSKTEQDQLADHLGDFCEAFPQLLHHHMDDFTTHVNHPR